MTISPVLFQKHILTWFDQHGRKDLPWQQNKTPYRVWISEIMLQQTQVSTVIPYFMRFMQQFPTLETLANADEEAVLHLWTGLGYYTRARNLYRAAKMIVQDYQNNFPDTLLDLQTLPGIGRSTAGAILALAFQKKAAILDGNVKRVLTRFHGITEWTGDKKIHEKLWGLTEQFTPAKRIADYTQAMMDLGATVCIRGKPLCEQCPLLKNCSANKSGIEKTLPRAKPRKTLPIKQASLLLLRNKHGVLLEKRPAKGIWGSLWCLPEIPGATNLVSIKKFCRQQFQISPIKMKCGETFRHTFSHFHLDITPVFATTSSVSLASAQRIWYNFQKSEPVGLPAPVKKLLEDNA